MDDLWATKSEDGEGVAVAAVLKVRPVRTVRLVGTTCGRAPGMASTGERSDQERC